MSTPGVVSKRRLGISLMMPASLTAQPMSGKVPLARSFMSETYASVLFINFSDLIREAEV
jgi:hypothetical protein